MKSDSFTDVMLPKHFHYHGMNKIKAGKGYRDGHPIGVIGGKCPECDGHMISIKMNTSSKGFETTSEKVCDTCGLVQPGAFQVLEPHPPYKSRPYQSHEDWVKHNCMDTIRDDDVAWDAESYVHATGGRLNTSDNYTVTGGDEVGFNNEHHTNPRLGKAIQRLADTPQSMHIPKSDRDNYYYRERAKDYGAEFGLSKFQIDEVIYILDHRGDMFNTRWKIDDIILCITIYVLSCYVNNGYMATIKRQIPMWKQRYSTMYQAIRSKMNG